MVTDEAGSPLSGALVEVDHYRGGGSFSNPASSCPDSPAWCWLVTYASGAGRYAVELDAAPSPQYPGTIGYVFSFYGGFEANTQFVPSGPTDVVQNLRLRRVRGIRAGASTTVSIESDSTRCTDLEDLWVMNSRCEAIQVVADAGTLVVQAQATEAGRAAPSVYWATTGNYAGIPTRPGPGVVSIPVGGGTYLIFVGVPADTASAPQSFSVSTTLHSTGGH